MNDIDPYKSLLARHGRSLHAVGVEEIGLSREHAFEAIECLNALGVAILGGDVYRFVGDRPEPTLDNWFCERTEGEPFEAFRQRSLEAAARYLTDYPDPGEGIVFSFVIGRP